MFVVINLLVFVVTGSGSVYNVTLWPAGNSCGTYLLRGSASVAPSPSKQALQINISSQGADSTNTTGNMVLIAVSTCWVMAWVKLQDADNACSAADMMPVVMKYGQCR